MEGIENKWGFIQSLVGVLCFVVFGIVAFVDLNNPYNRINIIVGVLLGLVFSFITKKLLTFFLSLPNKSVKKIHGKKSIKNAVSRNMVFMLPFTTMAFLSTYFLHWFATTAFVSTAIMTSGTLAVAQIGKLKDKGSIANPIISTICCATIACLWLISCSILRFLPQYIEVVIKNLPSLLSQIKG